MADDLTIRPAAAGEYAIIGDLTADAYVDGGVMAATDPYLARVRDAASRAASGLLLVASAPDGTILGTVTFCEHGSPYAQLTATGETEFRMLAVDPRQRGHGVGAALVGDVVRRSRELGAVRIRLSTGRRMTAAQRLYERLGFRRTPDRDWRPPGAVYPLRTYVFDL
ncbi:MAG: GNAT family N-acetyltransferase [Mycobacteriales bacterium]|nr:MAG: GNAT family N-acetyltransferase [Pseudonocardiales bacterium]